MDAQNGAGSASAASRPTRATSQPWPSRSPLAKDLLPAQLVQLLGGAKRSGRGLGTGWRFLLVLGIHWQR